MKLFPLGVGDAFARRHFSTALALQAEDRWLLIDCPHPIRRMMYGAATELDVGDIDAVVLTHLHGDHVSGLEGLAFYNLFKKKRRTVLLCHPQVKADLWERHLAVAMRDLMMPDGSPVPPMPFEAYFDWRPITPETTVEIGPFAIECRLVQHHIPTTAVRVTAGGRSMAYSADTRFDPALIEWMAKADLLVHETNVAPHTPYADLMTLPAELRARMRLVQYSDDFDVDSSEIEALREGRVYAVGPVSSGPTEDEPSGVAVLAGQARELLRCLISESIEQVDRQVTHLGEAIRITVASGAEISFLCNFGRFEIWDHIEGVGWEPVEQAPAGRILSIRPLAEGDGLLIDVDGTDLWVLYERFRRLVFEPADRYSNRASAVELSGPVDTRPVLKQLSTRREDSSQALLDAMVGAHHAWEQKDSQAMTMQTDRFLSGLGWDAFRLLAVRETLIATVDAPLRGLKRLSNGFVAQIACTDQRDAYDWACIYEESLWTAAAHAGFTAEIAVALDGKDFTLTLI